MADYTQYQPISQTPPAALITIPLPIESNGPQDLDEPKPSQHGMLVHASPKMRTRIQWIYFIFGCAILLPWNALITATPYFLSRLNGSPFQSTFTSYISSTYTAFKFLGLTYATYTSPLVPHLNRIYISILLLTILTLLLTISTFFHVSPARFFAFTLLNAIFQAVAAGYLQTSVMAIGALFGPSVMQAVMSGEAVVAVIVSGVQVTSAAFAIWDNSPVYFNSDVPGTSPKDGKAEQDTAFMLLGLSTLFLVFTIGAHAYLASMPEYIVAVTQHEQSKSLGDDSPEARERQGLLSGISKNRHDKAKAQIIRIAKANAPANIAVAFAFVSTLAVFPAITILVSPTNPDIHPLLFSAIHLLVFNIGDLLGRHICSYRRLVIWSQHMLLVISLARVMFIPLFMMCNIAGAVNPIITSDWVFMLLLLACGISGGYVSTACMMSASSIEHNPRLKGRVEDVDVASTVASFFFTGGLVVGGLMSFVVRFAFCRCNPFID